MVRKRYRKGDEFGSRLIYEKEVLNKYFHSGKRKMRMAFFSCREHPEVYFKMSHQYARYYNNLECPCNFKSNGVLKFERFSKEEVDGYSYAMYFMKLKRGWKQTPPQWFKVTDVGIYLDGHHEFYVFPELHGLDYLAAKKIEEAVWNHPKENKAFYLTRLSYEYDNLHRDGKIDFSSTSWNRGAGIDFFNEYLKENL